MLGFRRFTSSMSREDELNALNSNFADIEQESAMVSNTSAFNGGVIGDMVRTLKTAPTSNRLFLNGGTHKKDEYPDLWALNVDHPAYFSSSTSTTFTLVNMAGYEVIAKLR